MQLSVIIVSYNVKYYLEQCLYAVLAACKNIQSEIIVVDNASSDKSIDYVKPKFPQVIFIQNELNTGFAKANNKALQQAKGKYILYLNPDTIISEITITNCISFLDEHDEAGAIGIKMIDGNGNFLPESKRSFPSVMASFFKLSGMAALFPHSSIFNKYASGNLNENEIHETDVLSGAFFLSGKETLLSLNGFDEDFFMYGEDIDLSYRIQKAGCKNFYLGNNVIIHFKGESTQTDKQDYTKNFYGAMKIFVNKHYKNTSSILLKAAITTSAALSSSGKKLKRFFSSAENKKANNSFILLGDEDATKSAEEILLVNNLSYQCVILSNETNYECESLNVDPKLGKLQNVKLNIVFCTGELRYASCIQFIQNNKNKFVYYWHYKNSASIISATDIVAIPQIYIAT